MDVELNGETQIFPIIGDPIGQVKSPALLTEELVRRGINAIVIPAHVKPPTLTAFINGAKEAQNIGGMIITVPHKFSALTHCDTLTARAQHAGSVNILVRQADGKWLGDNTDGLGYVGGIRALGHEVSGNRALLVGVGGAGAAIAYELLAQGVSHLAIHDLETSRRDAAIERLSGVFPGKLSVGSTDPTSFDLVCNATPVGMRDGDPTPVEVEKLTGQEFVADSITKPAITPLLAAAAAKGCLTMPGLGMFNAQADILVDFLVTKTTR